jgi:hypothetical protein
MLSKQALYYPSSPFFSGYFADGVFKLFAGTGLELRCSISASQVGGLIDSSHWTPLGTYIFNVDLRLIPYEREEGFFFSAY